MKKLLVVRHAKSSWTNPTETDAERGLNPRGMRDISVMANKLLRAIKQGCQSKETEQSKIQLVPAALVQV